MAEVSEELLVAHLELRIALEACAAELADAIDLTDDVLDELERLRQRVDALWQRYVALRGGQ
jgi:hypothetical protein